MPPVRVKVYGLVSFTRRGYLSEAVVEWLLLVALASVWYLGYPHYREILIAQEKRPPLMNLTIKTFDILPYILAAAVVAKAIEMYFVLRIFARKEAAARQAPAPPPPDSACQRRYRLMIFSSISCRPETFAAASPFSRMYFSRSREAGLARFDLLANPAVPRRIAFLDEIRSAPCPPGSSPRFSAREQTRPSRRCGRGTDRPARNSRAAPWRRS